MATVHKRTKFRTQVLMVSKKNAGGQKQQLKAYHWILEKWSEIKVSFTV